MRTSILAALTGLAACVSARIVAIGVPSTIAPGSTFRAIIVTQNYVQSIQDISIAFGLSNNYQKGSLGSLLSSKYLGPDDSNIVTNTSHFLTIPASQAKGPVVLTAELYSLTGAAASGTLTDFAVNTTISQYTSSSYVYSTLS